MEKNKMSLTFKVLLGMLLGIIVGLVINLNGLNTPGSFINDNIVNGLFHVIGKMFINALKMLVVPLVFFSHCNGDSCIRAGSTKCKHLCISDFFEERDGT